MKTKTFSEFAEVMDAVEYFPAVSIIMSFDPKMSGKSELQHKLKLAYHNIENEIESNYSAETAKPILKKLLKTIDQLDYTTYKKSIGIFVSPVFQKIYYLNIPVEEKVIIDASFEIRDLVYSKKQLNSYLLLMLNSKRAKTYIRCDKGFISLVSDLPNNHHIENTENAINDICVTVANYSDVYHRKQVLLDEFMLEVDKGLKHLLQSYPLPLFIMGTGRTVSHFKKNSSHKEHIAGFIACNFEKTTEEELSKIMEPYIQSWQEIKEKDLLQQLDAAAGAKKLSIGIENVWEQAAKKKGRLLIVEKNFSYAARKVNDLQIVSNSELNYNPLFIKDAVDDVIEKVLDNGGDVEFVEDGLLNNYGSIALIKYY